ncbi:MAG: ferritin-like protein [Alphaproteobacteria bacterium]|nr:ferritin-like protein [Alphaproteobacteria bacterium]MBV9371319.1 ferritin-like protein [Alphaproteobacteria bacterium]MBV9901783.1 ferritin-like protein [Alphaproteobacteria bacterium]
MIRLNPSLLAGLDSAMPNPQAVVQALQSAVELEHSTIPLYLYALYSLDATKNAEIAAIIQSVVVEEMLHMTLASNVLNALGGSPSINQPGFIPTYPGPLPGGVESQLQVHLAPFSTTQLQTFLTIEEPENPLDFPTAETAQDGITIGQFYAAIARSIQQLGNGYFVDPPRNQVGPDLMYGSIVVTDVDTALQAIDVIVQQGEGTTTSPLEAEGTGYAHYYRYMEIYNGRMLIPAPNPGPNPDQKYIYGGDPVPFDQSGVYGVATDPGPYSPGTAAALANDNFNYAYTSLLNALHDMFNGDATEGQFNRCLGLMMSLKSQAKAMMSGIPNPGLLVGPTFQYQPVNPANA